MADIGETIALIKAISGQSVSDLKSAIESNGVEENLLRDELPGTSKTVTMDGNGNPTQIVHASNGTTIRTDVLTWTDSSVTEVRTLSSGKYIEIVTNLTTLAQTISAVQEVA